MPLQAARLLLRSATAHHHDRVDRLYSRADLGNRQSYAQFLCAQAAAHLAVEQALDRADAGALLDDWPQRRRGSLLRADLAALATPVPTISHFVLPPGAEAVLGAVYVLEGSRLGGRVLRRSVPHGFPTAFLDAADPAGWQRLLNVLEARLDRDDRRQRAIDAAVAVFTVFEDAAVRHLPPDPSMAAGAIDPAGGG